MRAAVGAAPGQVVVGAVGRLVAEKGYPELFDAMQRLDANRYLLVVIGGEDPDKPDALPKDVLARAEAQGVRFLGHREDVEAVYAAMDVFVLASHREGYPRAAMEAAAMGLPIVATNIRGCRQVVEPGQSGLLVPPRDADAIAAAIKRLGDAPALRARIGSAGRALARVRFDEREVVRNVLDSYRDVAARKVIRVERVDVLQVITSDDRRGPERHALDLGAALEARGHRVRTVALAPGHHGGGLSVPTLGRHPLGVATLRRLRRESALASVVIAHGSTTLPACALALAGTDVPFVYRSVGDPRHWAATAARRARLGLYLRRSHAVVALTSASARTIQSLHRVPDKRVMVIPIGLTSRCYLPVDEVARRAARDRFGIPADANVGAVISALSPEKNVTLAIDAAVALPGFHLVVAGDGPERESLEKRAALAAPGRVHFVGSVHDPTPVFASADVVLLTSRTEGLPAVLIEAGLRELPVVATDVGYVRDIVVDGETGLLVEPRDGTELVSAITRALRDGARLGKSARLHCLDRFDLERVADSWEALLTEFRSANRGASAPPTLTGAGAVKTASAPRAGSEEQ
jgi:glycosyltransferase involved in cell wall biosynthesis